MIQRICIAAKDRDTNSRWYNSKHSAILSSFHYYKWRLKRPTILNSIAIHLVTNIKPVAANNSKQIYPANSNSTSYKPIQMAETNCTLRKTRTKNWRKTAISITDGDGASLQQQLQYKFGFKGILEEQPKLANIALIIIYAKDRKNCINFSFTEKTNHLRRRNLLI